MYFPYLRGKQYELLALREVSGLLGDQRRVYPIIEPVRMPSGSGLDRCVASMSEADLDFVLVVNPNVGELRSNLIAPALSAYVNERDRPSGWNLGLLVTEHTDVRALLDRYRSDFGSRNRLTLIHKGLAEDLDFLETQTQDLNLELIAIDDRLRRRYYREALSRSSGITMRDGFPSEERNSAYLAREESIFSDDHLFFAEEGWFGFSDYLTIGAGYSDGGFTPRAVAIHWTYEPWPGAPIMIRHFTSESNEDTSNVGGKFLESVSKLVSFLDAHNIRTMASEVMRGHLNDQTYPGLGIVKKLSIQNHLELMSAILSRS